MCKFASPGKPKLANVHVCTNIFTDVSFLFTRWAGFLLSKHSIIIIPALTTDHNHIQHYDSLVLLDLHHRNHASCISSYLLLYIVAFLFLSLILRLTELTFYICIWVILLQLHKYSIAFCISANLVHCILQMILNLIASLTSWPSDYESPSFGVKIIRYQICYFAHKTHTELINVSWYGYL